MLADLQAKLIALLVVLLLLAAAALGAGWWAWGKGEAQGKASVQAEWDKEKREAEGKRDKAREEGYELAAAYESDLYALQQKHLRTLKELKDVQVQCPASGKLADVVIPRAVIDSMFLRDRRDAGAPGPSASQPDATVR